MQSKNQKNIDIYNLNFLNHLYLLLTDIKYLLINIDQINILSNIYSQTTWLKDNMQPINKNDCPNFYLKNRPQDKYLRTYFLFRNKKKTQLLDN